MSDSSSEPVKMIITPVRCEYSFTPGKSQQKFLKNMLKGKLTGQKCDGCNKVYIPPRGACGRCGRATDQEVEVKDTGTIVSFSIIRVPSQNITVELPYAAASVVLDGADISFSALIQGCSYDEVRIGMRVQGVWRPKEEWTTSLNNISHFIPLDEPDVPFEKIKEIS